MSPRRLELDGRRTGETPPSWEATGLDAYDRISLRSERESSRDQVAVDRDQVRRELRDRYDGG
jgi:hypothetical protein